MYSVYLDYLQLSKSDKRKFLNKIKKRNKTRRKVK